MTPGVEIDHNKKKHFHMCLLRKSVHMTSVSNVVSRFVDYFIFFMHFCLLYPIEQMSYHVLYSNCVMGRKMKAHTLNTSES
jgi:hypothetical protein